MAVRAYLVPSPSEASVAAALDDCVIVSIEIRRPDGTKLAAPRICARVGEPASLAVQGGTDPVSIDVVSRREKGEVVVTTTATLDKGAVLRDEQEAAAGPAPVAKTAGAPG